MRGPKIFTRGFGYIYNATGITIMMPDFQVSLEPRSLMMSIIEKAVVFSTLEEAYVMKVAYFNILYA